MHPQRNAECKNVGVMSSRIKRREVVEQDGVIGAMQGEVFSPESNFRITEILHYIITPTQSGFLVKIKSKMNDYERYKKQICRFTVAS